MPEATDRRISYIEGSTVERARFDYEDQEIVLNFTDGKRLTIATHIINGLQFWEGTTGDP